MLQEVSLGRFVTGTDVDASGEVAQMIAAAPESSFIADFFDVLEQFLVLVAELLTLAAQFRHLLLKDSLVHNER